jgi:hypothetical protein
VEAQTQELREQLERLQQELSARQSTSYFAHAGVSLVVAFIFGGATGKLMWDSAKLPYLALVGVAVTLGLVVYALARYRQGQKTLADELRRYETMLELRRRLGLDDPAALLPR